MADAEKDPLKLHVGSLNFHTTEDTLYNEFGSYGKVEKGKSCLLLLKISIRRRHLKSSFGSMRFSVRVVFVFFYRETTYWSIWKHEKQVCAIFDSEVRYIRRGMFWRIEIVVELSMRRQTVHSWASLTWGIRSMLSGPFYDSSVHCQFSYWLAPAFVVQGNSWRQGGRAGASIWSITQPTTSSVHL